MQYNEYLYFRISKKNCIFAPNLKGYKPYGEETNKIIY